MPAFRDSASFGKRIEFFIIGQMLKAGLDVYIPLVDDQGIDALVRRENETCAAVQIKARSKRDCKAKNATVFTVTGNHHNGLSDYWFVFYSEALDKTWILNSREFDEETTEGKKGRWIKFGGVKKGKAVYSDKKEQQYGRYEREYSYIKETQP